MGRKKRRVEASRKNGSAALAVPARKKQKKVVQVTELEPVLHVGDYVEPSAAQRHKDYVQLTRFLSLWYSEIKLDYLIMARIKK